jgi:hypothetical protein
MRSLRFNNYGVQINVENTECAIRNGENTECAIRNGENTECAIRNGQS